MLVVRTRVTDSVQLKEHPQLIRRFTFKNTFVKRM